MNTHAYFEEVIQAFGTQNGMPDLSFEADGLCQVAVDGEGLNVLIGRDVEGGRLLLLTVLDDALPVPLEQDWTRYVLETGLAPLFDSRKPNVGLDGASNRLMAYFALPVAQIDMALIGDRIRDLAAFRQQWAPLQAGRAQPDAPRARAPMQKV